MAEEALAEYRQLEPRDWIIRRDEVMISENVLGAGAWEKVYQGRFRGCQVAVKQIHDLILSPHNRRREMSMAFRCRHPNPKGGRGERPWERGWVSANHALSHRLWDVVNLRV